MDMQLLSNFHDNATAIVIGASGGIGGGFISHLEKQGNFKDVYGLSRSQDNFDIKNEESIKKAASKFEDRSIDLIIIATGLLGTEPEKSLKDLSLDKFQDIFATNTFGPGLVIKHFAPKLKRDSRSVMAALSARVGSIADNHLGGWYAYRSAKAALNMIIRCTAIEVKRNNNNACIIGLHPGTVDTSLSKPFQGHVPNQKLFTPEYATGRMLEVINSVSTEDSGHVFAYDGEKLPY